MSQARLLARLLAAVLIFACGEVLAVADEAPTLRDTMSDTWAATDGLGRRLPGFAECGPRREGRFVGIFGFTWQGGHPRDRVYDISKLLAADPKNPAWGPEGAFHWWGEPHLGYYVMDDEFVIRKHAQMLTDAGVDVMFLDVTNGFTYDHNFLTICRVYDRMRRLGQPTPQIGFLANAGADRVVRHLYDSFYGKGYYPDLWFRWHGKPIILAPAEDLDADLKDFFTLRQSWAWSNPGGWFGDGRDKWPWLDSHPQQPGWHEPGVPEELSVCVAQHPTSNIGRSFHAGKQPPPDQLQTTAGLCFQEQWERALEVDPQFVFITGWNEWIAQRFLSDGNAGFLGRRLPKGETFFVDQYSQEYSRDIEPMRGGHGDAYYYQMVSYIRRYKGVRPAPRPSAPRTIAVPGPFAQWAQVNPLYLDDLGDTAHRDHPGYGQGTVYRNTSGRNDFERLRVARDDRHVFFYARTRAAITAPEGSNWMVLLLNTDGGADTGWNGYDLLVNRHRPQPGTCSVEQHSGSGWNWRCIGQASLEWDGRELHLAVPRALLGSGRLTLEFKWADNVPERGDIMDFIDQGDVAPNGRFNYCYVE
ncbi:MAG: hypothetical protein HPY69_02310 [Armatimonadetes bacterium]|nr:hypothetical protein [Armatimonadota bacterium]